MGVNLLSQLTRDNTRGNGLELYQGRLKLDIRKNFFTEIGSGIWSGHLGKWWSKCPWQCSKPCGYGSWGHGLVMDLAMLV